LVAEAEADGRHTKTYHRAAEAQADTAVQLLAKQQEAEAQQNQR